MKKYGIFDGVPLRTTHAHAVSIMLLQIRKYMFKDWDISCLQGMIGTYHVLTSFFLLFFLSSVNHYMVLRFEVAARHWCRYVEVDDES